MGRSLIAIVGFMVVIAGCKKDPGNPYGNSKPSVQAFMVTNHCPGTVGITGTSFDPNITEDSVYFGNIKGTILSVNATNMVAQMPAVNIAGKITVYCEGRPSISNDSIFQYIPEIISFTPALAGPGTRITISGHGFNPDPKQDSLYFNNIPAVIYSADTNQLVALVPSGGTTGIISLHSNCQYATAPGSFTLSNKGMLFIGTNGSYFYSVDIASGVTRWTYPIFSGTASPIYNNGVVYISGSPGSNQSNIMYALDANTGKQLWNFSPGSGGGYPSLSQDTIFFGGYDNNFYALRAANGQKIWSFAGANGNFFNTTAAFSNGAIYTQNGTGNFYSLNSSTGNMNWKLFIWPDGSPTVVNGIVYTSGMDSAGENAIFYSLDAGTGEVKWKLNIYELGGTPLVANGLVYVGDGEGYLNAIDAVSGQPAWRTNAGPWTYFAELEGNDLYYTTESGYLQKVDASSGNVVWSVLLASNPFVQPGAVFANGALYAGDNVGTLHAINAASGATIWTFQTTGAPIMSSPCIVDSSGNVFYGGK